MASEWRDGNVSKGGDGMFGKLQRGLGIVGLALLVWAGGVSMALADVKLANYAEGETVRHSVVLLCGSVDVGGGKEDGRLLVKNLSSQRETKELSFPVVEGKFRALAELVEGENRLELIAGNEKQSLVLHYKPQTNAYFVRVIYFTDNSGATEYQTPKKDDPQNFAAKLDTGMKLLQTFTAERMKDVELGRHTFVMEQDDAGKVKVHVLKGARSADYYRSISDNELYSRIRDEVKRAFPDDKTKNVVLMAFTKFDPVQKKALGHTALGGGDQALFGGGTLYSWPNSLADVERAFGDDTLVDRTQVFDDSAGRGTMWGNAATGLGATLHELGHTLGLPHVRERNCIMSRGFDGFNRVFSLVEPKSRLRKAADVIREKNMAWFSPESASSIRASEWLRMDDLKEATERQGSEVSLDSEGNLKVVAGDGVRYIGFQVNDEVVGFKDYWRIKGVVPTEVTLSADEVETLTSGKAWKVGVRDDRGGLRWTEQKELKQAGQFVRRWSFAKEVIPWTKTRELPELSDEKREAIQKEALAGKLVEFGSAYVDYERQFPEGSREMVAGYAVTKFTLKEAKTLRLLTGSDDGLRVWIDGTLVQKQLALRSARQDQDQVQVSIPAGEHVLLVEVMQGRGGWGLFLRFTDEQGKAWGIDADGVLKEL